MAIVNRMRRIGLSSAGILWSALVCSLSTLALAEYPETNATCVTTAGSECNSLGTIQCVEQQGAGTCRTCGDNTELPQTTCVIVSGGKGCKTGTDSMTCGIQLSGTCVGTYPDTVCFAQGGGGLCTAVVTMCTQ